MPTLHITITGAQAIGAKLRGLSDALAGRALEDATTAGALIVLNAAQRAAPVKTGSLRRSLHTETVQSSRSLAIVAVGTDLSYAPLVEHGTRAHIIYPRDKQALWWPGARHPVRSVHHPGTKAQPYLIPALVTNATRVKDEIATALRLILERL